MIFDTFFNLQEQEKKRDHLNNLYYPQIEVSDNSFIIENEDHELVDPALKFPGSRFA